MKQVSSGSAVLVFLAAAACIVAVSDATYCSSPPSLAHGWHSGGTKQYFKVGYVVTYTCKSGYRLVGGGKTLTCSYRWSYSTYWKGMAPRCEPYDTEDSSHSGSRYSHSDSDSSHSGGYGSDSSRSGFHKSGSKSSHSDDSKSNSDSGSFDGSKSDSSSSEPSRIRCPPLEPPENGRVHVIGYYPGNFARYLCNYGYIHTDTLYRNCRADGTWSGKAPTCIRYMTRECDRPESPVNGSVQYTSTSIGSKAFYSCDSCFTLVGSKVRVCQHSQTWTPEVPRCEERTECERLMNPRNGFVVVGERTIGAYVKYNCDEGFYLFGPKFRQCQKTGWTDTEPKCLPVKCDQLEEPKNGAILFSNGLYFNSVATYTCDYSYTLDKDSGDKTRLCQNFGEWTGTAPRCIKVECGELEAPPHGRILVRGKSPHSRAYYKCDDEHTLRGQSPRLCLEDGQWSGTPPSCIPKPDVKCPMPRAPTYGHVQTQCLHQGCVASFSCPPNYRMQGRNKARCLATRKWSAQPPSCIRKRWQY